MIKRIILFATILFTFYSIFVSFYAPKWWSASQHYSQENVIKAQKFIFNESDSFDNVVVGSSLSSLLITDSLPRTYNLSFVGQSIYDGLNIISRKKNQPKSIFIEMNYMFRDGSPRFISSLYSRALYYPRKFIPALREDKQPVGIFGIWINKIITTPILESSSQDQTTLLDKKAELFNKLLNIQKTAYSEPPPPEVLRERVGKLKDYVIKLEAKGINVVFYEMPVNNQLLSLPQVKKVREIFSENFPSSKYRYILSPNTVEYETTDGLHLTSEARLLYTSYFKIQMDSLHLDSNYYK